MTLIKSISGIRGTIGGTIGDNLDPVSIVKFATAYGIWIRKNTTKQTNKIVIGRDARISGEMVYNLVCGSLISLGFDVVNLGLVSTPTTELAVISENACGGIIITASHNPKQWNALKLLNENGEFLNATNGEEVLTLAEKENFLFSDIDAIGKIHNNTSATTKHIESILTLDLVDTEAIKKANFRVAIDCVNSVGGICIPELLNALGVNHIIKLNCEPNGIFSHNPEPLPENLTEISDILKQGKADVGFVVDPDVDRLAIVCENGEMFGEEYTLVAVADYILSHTPGNTVSNLSSTRALRDVTEKYGQQYYTAAVGEVNVVAKMKEVNAVIGGEGNGGVIYPESHYGRDALAGIALFLSLLAHKKTTASELRKTYPAYFISKNKIELTTSINVDAILEKVKEKFTSFNITDIDGVKIDFPDKWVHLRKSNTEPIIRIYAEAQTPEKANKLASDIIEVIDNLTKPN